MALSQLLLMTDPSLLSRGSVSLVGGLPTLALTEAHLALWDGKAWNKCPSLPPGAVAVRAQLVSKPPWRERSGV